MTDILGLSLPVYLAIDIGFLATHLGLFVKPEMRVLGKFVINFALPAMLLKALSQRPLADIIQGKLSAGLYAGFPDGHAGRHGLGAFCEARQSARPSLLCHGSVMLQ